MKKTMDFPKVAMKCDVFPANKKGHTYKPAPYHGASIHSMRGGRKTRWTIPQNGQYFVFSYADERNRMDEKVWKCVLYVNNRYMQYTFRGHATSSQSLIVVA